MYLSFGCRSSVASIADVSGAWAGVWPLTATVIGCALRFPSSGRTSSLVGGEFQLFVLTRMTCCAGSAFSAPLTSSGA